MEHEALGVIGAGIETTKHAATICCFHVLSNPRIFETLQKELMQVMPDPRGPIPGLSQLEALPYLSACIEEGESSIAALRVHATDYSMQPFV